MWTLRYDNTLPKCKECDYWDFCSLLATPADEACEAIKSCTKEFLYEKIWESLDEYFKTNQND